MKKLIMNKNNYMIIFYFLFIVYNLLLKNKLY